MGAYYTITTITELRRPLFDDPTLAQLAMLELDETRRDGAIEPLAWVLMPEHLHVVVRLDRGTLSQAIQALKSRTARAINAARGTMGRVWQPGFYDHYIRDERDLLAQARYVVENPVRRGLAARCEDYPHWWCQWLDPPPAL
ncbi:transposase [Lysobacter tyrosinilyticus]